MPISINGAAGVTFPDTVLQPNGVPAPSTTGNVLTSNGTAWISSAPATPAAPAALSTASGSAPSYSARAWVNIAGTASPPSIRAGGNVSSITDNGNGDYTVNFTTALPDANYSVAVIHSGGGNDIRYAILAGSSTSDPTQMTSSALRVRGWTGSDNNVVTVTVFR